LQVVILAGGLGTRLGELTRDMPKVMISFAGRPFLYYVLQLLKNQGIKDVVICSGYLGEQIEDFFGDGHRLGVNIKYSQEEEKLLGTGGALKQARHMLDGLFLVLNGDTYLPVDYHEIEEKHLRLGRKALMVVYNNEIDTGVRNNIALDRNRMVVRYDRESASPDLKYVEAGAVFLRREALDFIPDGVPISLEDGIYRYLIEQGELAAHISEQRFYDIGTLEQQRVFEELMETMAQ
jgi:NDP-sugar pyrophosphorylase family protein